MTRQAVPQDHARHSALVRHFRPIHPTTNTFGLDWREGSSYALRSPHAGHLIQVSFATYPDRPNLIQVRSTNWRCEYEPGGGYDVRDARLFYKTLLGAGFVRVEIETHPPTL